MVDINLKISNRTLFFLTGLIILIGILGVVYSSIEDQPVWHHATEVASGVFGAGEFVKYSFSGLVGLATIDYYPKCDSGNLGTIFFHTGEDESMICTFSSSDYCWKGLISGKAGNCGITCDNVCVTYECDGSGKVICRNNCGEVINSNVDDCLADGIACSTLYLTQEDNPETCIPANLFCPELCYNYGDARCIDGTTLLNGCTFPTIPDQDYPAPIIWYIPQFPPYW